MLSENFRYVPDNLEHSTRVAFRQDGEDGVSGLLDNGVDSGNSDDGFAARGVFSDVNSEITNRKFKYDASG